MRVGLTGASGLIGSAIAAKLASEGHEILRIGRRDDDVFLDLAAPLPLARDSLAGLGALIHAAGITEEDFANRERAFGKAIHGTSALLTAAQAAGIGRLAYISSAHVYGPLEGRIDETRPPNPISDYAICHFVTEQLFRRASLQSLAGVLLLRPCAVYGLPPSLDRFMRWSLIPFDFPRQAITRRIVLKTDGTQRRNFVAAEGLGDLAVQWLNKPATGLAIANATGRDEMTVYEFARLCAKVYEEESGFTCEVERPHTPGLQHGQPFEYRSGYCNPLAEPGPQDHVRSLIRVLLRRPPHE
jgi:UDP-glucose 4-epimerase